MSSDTRGQAAPYEHPYLQRFIPNDVYQTLSFICEKRSRLMNHRRIRRMSESQSYLVSWIYLCPCHAYIQVDPPEALYGSDLPAAQAEDEGNTIVPASFLDNLDGPDPFPPNTATPSDWQIFKQHYKSLDKEQRKMLWTEINERRKKGQAVFWGEIKDSLRK